MTYTTSKPNKHFAKLTVTLKVLRAFGQSKQATVKLFSGKKGRIINDMIVIDVLVEGETMQIVGYSKNHIDKIKTIGINGEVVARRKAIGQPLLTTGAGWREYSQYMP